MNDQDLEDLESQLYSQVYHGAADEVEENRVPPPANNAPPTNVMGKQGGRYFGPWSPRTRNKPTAADRIYNKFLRSTWKGPQKSHPEKRSGYLGISKSDHMQTQNSTNKTNFDVRSPNESNSERIRTRNSHNKANSESVYSKNHNKPRKPPLINQTVVLTPEKTSPFMNSKEKSKARWKAKMRERVKQKRAEKWQNASKESSVITVSDTDEEDDSCVLLENDWPLLSVADSDDENAENGKNQTGNEKSNVTEHITLKSEPIEILNESITDDVIYVESVAAPPVLISIDEEAENQEKSTSETSTSSNNTCVRTPSKNKTRLNERKELLNTPDSASNDFINNSEIELHERDFNFGLHGSDFHNPGEFLKPAPRNETCETESSSSTTDANSVNLIKTVVFNEVDFPKDDIFSENNLETFGNFITPLRNNPVQSSPVKTTDGQNKYVFPSDSSSESDSEESQTDRSKEVAAKLKQLPELSPMHTKNDVPVPQFAKKAKKITNISSKYDLLSSTDVTTQISNNQKDSAKKKKKNKKRKSVVEDNTDDNVNNVSEIETPEGVEGNDDLKRRKRKSSQLENNECLETQHVKKKLSTGNTEQNDGLNEINNSVVEPVSTISNTGEAEERENKDTNVASVSNKKISFEERGISATHDEKSKEDVNLDEHVKSQDNLKSGSESMLDGLEVIDETFDKEPAVLLSDSESVLSPLNEIADIQLNFENSELLHTYDDLTTPAFQPKRDLENCSVKDLQMDMSSDPSLWVISESDRNPQFKGRGRRCTKCKQFGHIAIRCPAKMEAKCALCGGSGHYEPRCPNKICTQCGQRSPYSTTYCGTCFKYRKSRCRICSMSGHLPNSCPDLWRRYHLTIEEGPIVTYNAPAQKEKKQLWCSGCAQSGHLEHSCRFYKSIYPPTDPFIKSYAPVYERKIESFKRSERREERIEPWLKPPQQPPLLPIPPLLSNQSILRNPNLIRIPPFLQGQVPNQIPNFAINQMNNQIYHSFDDQGRSVGDNYQEENYRQMNFVNPFVDRIYVANQQNFYPSIPTLMQLPLNHQNQPQNDFHGNPPVLDAVLPDFISLEPEPETPGDKSYEEVSQLPSHGRYFKTGQTTKQRNAMFFNAGAQELQHFINDELRRLSKLAISSEKHAKELKRMQIPRRKGMGQEAYYEKVNMMLFGVFLMVNGKGHLERLKQFRMGRLKSRLDYHTRKKLHTSYCYIFGREKNDGVRYHDLLRTI